MSTGGACCPSWFGFVYRPPHVATPYPDRAYDLDGDGNVIGLDKQWMNLALNNVPLE